MLVVPAANGWLWLKRGFGFFGRAPLTWILVAVSYWVLVSVGRPWKNSRVLKDPPMDPCEICTMR